MSLLDPIAQTLLMPALQRTFGDPATYEAAGGDSVATWAILRKFAVPFGEFGERVEFKETAELPKSDVPQPLSGSILTVQDKGEYRIGALMDANELFCTVIIKRID
jgi:hypothetical protein